MLKGKSIIGKEILSLEEGVKLNKVTDVIVDPEGLRVVALVVTEGGFMSSSKVIPLAEVESFGKDAVVIRSAQSIVSASAEPGLQQVVERDEKILGKTVYTTTGDDQGSIADIYFEESTGTVVGYEVSAGRLGDAAKGRSYLATDEITAIGNDVIYVEPETAATLDGQVGGIQGAMQGAGQKLGDARDGARDRAAGATPEERLVGRRTGSDIETDNGSVIIPKGRRVTPDDVAAAKASGKLKALTSSVAMGDAQEAGADAKDALGTAGDKAGSVWDQFTAKIGEMTDNTGRRMDEAKTKQRLTEIADAIGRPVGKVILDRQDNVILNMGDIITHGAVQRAHESGGLDSLLTSVYKGEVAFTKEEMRAPAVAEATVEKSTGGAVIVDQLESQVQTADREHEMEKQQKRQQADADRERREAERRDRAGERGARKERGSETPQPVSSRSS